MSSLDTEEKRWSARYPLERLAKIQGGTGHPPTYCYCLVTNISDSGVRVSAFGGEVPDDEFVLLLSGDGPARDGTYKVIWRNGNDVGAKLVSAVTQSCLNFG